MSTSITPPATFHTTDTWARQAQASGQKVIGYVANNVPVELILAAGMVPFEATGDPHASTERGDRYMEDFHDGHVRSLFSRAISGDFEFLDLLIIPRSSEGYLQLYYYLLEAKKWEPELRLPELYLFDLLQTPFWVTGRYVKTQVVALRDKLGEVAGRPIDDEAVWTGIHTANATRRRLAEVNALRRDDPALLPGSDMLRIIRAGGFQPRAEYDEALDALLARYRGDRGVSSRPRVLVKGSPQDSTDFYELLESEGLDVVADDHFTGERSFEAPVETHQESPLEALTRKYQFFSASPRSYPQSVQDDIFVSLVDDAEVDAVIFFLEENDDTFGWDYPAQKRLLDDRGVPSLYLKYQPYFGGATEEQRHAIAEFATHLTTSNARTAKESA